MKYMGVDSARSEVGPPRRSPPQMITVKHVSQELLKQLVLLYLTVAAAPAAHDNHLHLKYSWPIFYSEKLKSRISKRSGDGFLL